MGLSFGGEGTQGQVGVEWLLVSGVLNVNVSIADARQSPLAPGLFHAQEEARQERIKIPISTVTQKEDRWWSGVLSLASCGIAKYCFGTVNSSHLLAWILGSSPAGICRPSEEGHGAPEHRGPAVRFLTGMELGLGNGEDSQVKVKTQEAWQLLGDTTARFPLLKKQNAVQFWEKVDFFQDVYISAKGEWKRLSLLLASYLL